METQISKHAKKRARLQAYFRTLDGEVELPAFKERIFRSLNNHGRDIAPDGHPIKADFWRYIRSRKRSAPQNALAASKHMADAIASIRPTQPLM
jgi:hypothetical protein